MRKMVFGVAVALTVGASFGADVFVDVGQTRELTSGDYGAVFVNGTCTIPADAVVTCTSLMVASGDVNNVVFTVGPRAHLTVTGESKTYIGYDSGAGTFTLETNAVMTCQNNCKVRYRIDSLRTGPNMITVNLREGARVEGVGTDNCFYIGDGPAPSSQATTPDGTKSSKVGITTTVNLDAGSALHFSCVQAKTRPNVRINFNGGCISNKWNTSLSAMVYNTSPYNKSNDHNTMLYLTSVNGNPIRLYKASHAHVFFAQKSNGGTHLEGNIELAGTSDDTPGKYYNRLFDGEKTRFHFNESATKTETVWFKGSVRPQCLFADVFPTTAKIVVEKNARFELAGFPQTVAGISGEGCVTNRGEAAAFTLNNTDDSTIGAIYENVQLVKQGTGSLTVGSVNSAKVDIDVQAGAFSVGRTGALGTFALDAAQATADFGVFAPAANTVLALTNFTAAEYPAKLPIGYTSIADRSALSQWTVTLDGTPFAAQPLTAHVGSLYLGQFGLVLFVR